MTLKISELILMWGVFIPLEIRLLLADDGYGKGPGMVLSIR